MDFSQSIQKVEFSSLPDEADFGSVLPVSASVINELIAVEISKFWQNESNSTAARSNPATVEMVSLVPFEGHAIKQEDLQAPEHAEEFSSPTFKVNMEVTVKLHQQTIDALKHHFDKGISEIRGEHDQKIKDLENSQKELADLLKDMKRQHEEMRQRHQELRRDLSDTSVSSDSDTVVHPPKKIKKEGKVECNRCDKKLSDRQALRKHVTVVHLKIRNFQCMNCNKCFGSRQQLERHQNSKNLEHCNIKRAKAKKVK